MKNGAFSIVQKKAVSSADRLRHKGGEPRLDGRGSVEGTITFVWKTGAVVANEESPGFFASLRMMLRRTDA
jgi:hypothetical protein